MIGTIWTAPPIEKRYAGTHDAANGGNIDCPELSAGNTIYLPVSVPGGMVSIGDVHACMGDSEFSGYAMETAADVHIRIELIKKKNSHHLNCPQIESARTIGSVGCHFGQPLGENIKAGAVNINAGTNNWDEMACFGGCKDSGMGRNLSTWIQDEITETKQILLDISKVK